MATFTLNIYFPAGGSSATGARNIKYTIDGSSEVTITSNKTNISVDTSKSIKLQTTIGTEYEFYRWKWTVNGGTPRYSLNNPETWSAWAFSSGDVVNIALEIEEISTNTYSWDCYDDSSDQFLGPRDSAESQSTSYQKTRPTKDGYTYVGWSIGSNWNDALSGSVSSGTTATATVSKPFIVFHYTKDWTENPGRISLSVNISSSVNCYDFQRSYKVFRVTIPANLKGSFTFTCYSSNGSANQDIIINSPDVFNDNLPSVSFSDTGIITSGIHSDSKGASSTPETLTVNISSVSSSPRTYWIIVTGYNGVPLNTLYYTITYNVVTPYNLTITYNGTKLVDKYSISGNSVDVYLGSTKIGSISYGTPKKLDTKNLFATSDIKIGVVTLNCKNKMLLDDVLVTIGSN